MTRPRRPRPSSYQEKLPEALALYSRSTLARRPADKLVYILATLESFLLVNQSEPIQTTLGHRMAFLLETTADGRRKIIDSVKQVYAVRAAFLHHGVERDALETLLVFMDHTWRSFEQAILAAERFERWEDPIAAIDRTRLS